MKTEKPAVRMPSLGRREFVQATTAAAVAVAASGATSSASAQGAKIEAQEHWAKKGNVDLYLYRKRTVGDGNSAKPVLFLVHGSTFSCRGSYDLQVPGRQNYSMMDHFAGARLRRVVDGPRGLWPLLAHRRPCRHHGRRRGPEGGDARGRARHRAQLRPDARPVLGRHPRRRLCDCRARARGAAWCSTPSPTRARTRRRSSAAARWPIS